MNLINLTDGQQRYFIFSKKKCCKTYKLVAILFSVYSFNNCVKCTWDFVMLHFTELKSILTTVVKIKQLFLLIDFHKCGALEWPCLTVK